MGPVLDIRFADGELPELLNAIELQNHGKQLIVEVAQQIGDNVVRCIAMKPPMDLCAVPKAVDTGGPIKVPVGDACLGRVFNLLGEPVDEQPAPTGVEQNGRSTARPLLSMNRIWQLNSWKPASRSLT